ncbi:radical SAM/SPASM domain-containing protein [Thomasclavelia cocleata]|jgi:hypothetical protein|uniref:radical SAM/SPASM domain-containing protein n=1 Tax=Thomasclavelia cocleata TaxID=69824 RepID=UPI0025A19931|nr:radical SAM/SPASM domain-containing protein [Thomasclavelia cocleata]
MLKLFKKKEPKVIPSTEAFACQAFENEAYKALEINYDNFFEKCLINFDKQEEYTLKDIKRISFELSNICNYSYIHKKCPLSLVKDKKVLSSQIIYKCIDELATINFDGVVAFHRYNEPLIDPRLCQFIEYTNKKLPLAKILILTNGFYLSEEIVKHFEEYKIWCICVSAYFKSEYERISKIETNIPLRVFYSILDDRESIYDDTPKNCNTPCISPLSDLTVTCEGTVGLCCLDWKNRFTFGKLHEKSISEIIDSDYFQATCLDLQKGNRKLLICKNCDWIR